MTTISEVPEISSAAGRTVALLVDGSTSMTCCGSESEAEGI